MHCHPFQVDEVFRSIVEELVALRPRSALSLALCSKSLKDLSLSVLWERQKRLSTLIKVLPPDAWAYQETDSPAGELTILRDISPQEWGNLKKYASWMREIQFLEDEDEISQDIFNLLLQSPYAKPLCPRLLKLSWIAGTVSVGDFTPFISPQLQDIRLVSRPGTRFSFPHTISALPISSLKTLRLSIAGDELVREAIASMFKTCKSLTILEVSHMDQLRVDSWCRIISLPRLRILETDQWPPTVFPPGLPVFFPSLQRITLLGINASTWVEFLADERVQRIFTDAGSQPRRVAPHLTELYCDYEADLYATSISYFRVFRNLSILTLRTGCFGITRCRFRLTDDDISRLAIELPGLKELSFGTPCTRNTCWTTVISLLVLSTHCKGLHKLRIHFNTQNLARDVWQSLRHPLRRNSHPPSRCPLVALEVGLTPLTAEALGRDLFPTLAGLVDIFPRLQRISYTSSRASRGWKQLDAQIPSFQEMRRSLPVVFAQHACGLVPREDSNREAELVVHNIEDGWIEAFW